MLPYMTAKVKKERKSISTFGGINQTVSRGDGELTECNNTSGRRHPALSCRSGRIEVKKTGVNINGIGYKNALFYTGTTEDAPLDTKIYFDSKEALVSTDSTEELANRHRSFAHQGNSVLIIPDGKVYNTTDNSVFTIKYERTNNVDTANELAREEGNTDNAGLYREQIGEITSTGIESNIFYSSNYTIYLMPFEGIRAGDIVNISIDVLVYNQEETDEAYIAYKEKMKKGFDLKVIDVTTNKYNTSKGEVERVTAINFGEGVLDKGGYSSVYIKEITIKRQMADLSYICSLNNRVWGVHENTIRCSKQGDCSQWFDFTADSYGTLPSSCFSTEVDTRGNFTAIVPYGGAVVAFKENCLHKIYGTDPESYTLSTLECNGVKEGCANTVAVLKGVVYYMGIDGVYAYRGGMPTLVSKKLDLTGVEIICANTDGKNYYLVCKEGDISFMYVYYPECQSWHKEQISENTGFMVSSGSKIYSACKENIISLTEEGSSEKINWSFSLEFDEEMYYTRSYGKLLVNYSLAKDGEFVIRSICDGNTHILHISPENNHRENAYSVIPLPQIGCKDFRLEFEGKGDFTLKNITREYVITPEENSN